MLLLRCTDGCTKLMVVLQKCAWHLSEMLSFHTACVAPRELPREALPTRASPRELPRESLRIYGSPRELPREASQTCAPPRELPREA